MGRERCWEDKEESGKGPGKEWVVGYMSAERRWAPE